MRSIAIRTTSQVRPPESVAEINLQTDQVTVPIQLCNLPPFNAIATHVLSLTADPDIDLSQISRVIEADPAFAADILFLANSSLFGFPSRMYVLRHAMSVLGLDRIKALALTVAMRGFVGMRNPLVHQCWQHSVACAIICEELSPIFSFSSGRAYTAGIMHDIGRLGLLKAYPKQMAAILSCDHENPQAVLRAEREELNVDHGRAGSWLVSDWAFPKDFAEICAHHHDVPRASDSEILRLVKVACNLADMIGFPAVRCIQPPVAISGPPLRPGRNVIPPVEDLRASVTARMEASEG